MEEEAKEEAEEDAADNPSIFDRQLESMFAVEGDEDP
jgi:hypothetical protein